MLAPKLKLLRRALADNSSLMQANVHSHADLKALRSHLGGIVDEADAALALQQGTLGSYCADVFEKEPPAPTNPLLQCASFHGTPHVGGATLEAQARVGLLIAESVLQALSGELGELTEGEGPVVASGAAANDASRYMW